MEHLMDWHLNNPTETVEEAWEEMFDGEEYLIHLIETGQVPSLDMY